MFKHRAPHLRKLSFPTRASAAQSFSTMQSPRVTRNKRQSPFAAQTSRFNVPASACVGVSAPVPIPRSERSSPPRPALQSGRAGYPQRGSAPMGEPFPATFRFATKSSPCGAQTNNSCLQKIRNKTSKPLQIKNKHYLQITRRTRSVQLKPLPRAERQASPFHPEIFRLLKSTTHPAPVAKAAGSATRRIVRFRVSRVVAVSMREDGQVA